MKQNKEKKIKNKKLSILLLQCAIAIGCIIIFYIVMTPKDRVKDTTYSYSKLEEVKEYEIEGNYITRVRPLTEYKVFKETAEYTLNNNQEGKKYKVKIYSDSNKAQEVTEGNIKSGMVLEGIPNSENAEKAQTVTYNIAVIGDFTKDGDINVTELTKIIKGVVGLNDWIFTAEEKLIADFNGDKEINVVDIEECINYIVYGKLTLENGTKLKATDEYGITWNYTYKDGNATDVYYESGELSEEVVIPNFLDGYIVTNLANSRIRYGGNIFAKNRDEENTTVKKVIIPQGVTNIGKSTFYGCISLESIKMSEGVTRIDDYAFWGCISLTNIVIPDSVISIGNKAFYNCSSLTNIVIPNGVTSIEDFTFSGCKSLSSIEISDTVTSIGLAVFDDTEWYKNQEDGLIYAGKVAYKYKGEMESNTIIEIKEGTNGIASHAFAYTCLTKITIPDSVISIGEQAFNGCSNLTSIEIPDSVKSIGSSAFYDCRGLIKISIPGSVETIPHNLFFNCINLMKVDLEQGVKIIEENTFFSCANLTSINIPDTVTSIGNNAFYSCGRLIEISIPDSVISIGMGAFKDTAWYNSQPDGLVYAGKVAYTYKGTMPENTVIELKEGTKGIASKAFGYTELTEIVMPDGLNNIGNDAFFGCSNLVNIKIPEGVTSIENSVFRECTNLKSIEIPNSVISIEDSAFKDCTSLISITIPEGVIRIEQAAFENCRSLESIVIWKNVNELGYRTFNGWTDRQTINIEANKVPEGWDERWDYGCNAKIVYGYTGE